MPMILNVCRILYNKVVTSVDLTWPRLLLQLVLVFCVMLLVRIGTTLNPSWDREFEIPTVTLIAGDGLICARVSTTANLVIWIMMTSLLLLPTLQIRHLIQFGVTTGIVVMNLLLLAYECFAVYINYLTWSSDLSIVVRLLQIIPTIIVILHTFSEVEFFYLNKKKCARYFSNSCINPFFFATFNICLNGAMILHLVGVITVATIKYPYLFDTFLIAFGLLVAGVKFSFRLFMIYEYKKLIAVHHSHEGEVRVIEAAQNNISMSTSIVAIEKDDLSSCKRGQLVTLLNAMFAHAPQLDRDELVV